MLFALIIVWAYNHVCPNKRTGCLYIQGRAETLRGETPPRGKRIMERERDPATIEKLKQLRQKLMSDNISYARVAAFQLSWMQEDGMAVLQEALFGNYPHTAKKAAAYGIRSMRGRMKKVAVEVLEKGVTHQDKTTREVSKTSLGLMRGEITVKAPKRKPKPGGKRPPGQKPHDNYSKRQIRSVPSSEPNGNLKNYRPKPHPNRRGYQ